MIKTIKDIAKNLNLSTATVSRALNSETEHLVQSQTRQKILEYIKNTGYKPNIKARSLAKGKLTDLFLFSSQRVTDSVFYDEYYANVIRGIHSVIFNTDYSLVILPIDKTCTSDDIYKILLNHETAGLILSPYCGYLNFPFDEVKRYTFPVVTLDDIKIDAENAYAILLDHEGAGYLGAQSFIERGYKNLAVISDTHHVKHSEIRKQGFYRFFKEKNIDIPIKEIEAVPSYISAQPVLEKILAECKLPVGIFTLNDEIAVGIVNQMKDKGLNCPKDIGVLGFDGLSIRRYVAPPVNSIGFSYSEIGETAAKILIDVLNGKMREKTTMVKASLKDGASF